MCNYICWFSTIVLVVAELYICYTGCVFRCRIVQNRLVLVLVVVVLLTVIIVGIYMGVKKAKKT